MSDKQKTSDSDRKLFYGLFMFPLVIAVGMAILLCAVVFLTNEKQTPETLIASIKSGTKEKGWQKAFELSNELNAHPQSATPAILKEVLYIFDAANGYDNKTRAYMALALPRFEGAETLATLENALSDESEDVRLYALWSIGKLKNTASTSRITPLLSSESAEIRKTAAYVLGAIGDPVAAPALRGKLTDAVPDVRWNAALALARLRDASGSAILSAMLDRTALETELKLPEDQIEGAMINAAKGLALIREASSVTILQSVARQDRNLKVRQAAIEALDVFKQK